MEVARITHEYKRSSSSCAGSSNYATLICPPTNLDQESSLTTDLIDRARRIGLNIINININMIRWRVPSDLERKIAQRIGAQPLGVVAIGH